MSGPVVCAVMLVSRPEMTRRAIASFRAQTYERKRLFILDSGSIPVVPEKPYDNGGEMGLHRPQLQGWTIGALRNFAGLATEHIDTPIIAHFDSDDWSHPRRLEEQVALLIASGKECVGYRELLFWDTRWPWMPRNEGAWLYSDGNPSTLTGASMCYWRRAWKACPFDDAPHEDRRWQLKNAAKCYGVSALQWVTTPCEPRLICGIHGANTEVYDREKMQGDNQVWKRVPEWDRLCAERMAL